MANEHHAYYGAAVYGSILVSTLTGALLHTHETAAQMTLTVAVSMVVFWLAHAWSETVGERVAEGHRFDRSRIRDIARAEWPLVEAALLPTLLLALAWAGVWTAHTGIVLALIASVVQLIGWGFAAGYRTAHDWHAALLAGIGDGVLGVAIVALELSIH